MPSSARGSGKPTAEEMADAHDARASSSMSEEDNTVDPCLWCARRMTLPTTATYVASQLLLACASAVGSIFIDLSVLQERMASSSRSPDDSPGGRFSRRLPPRPPQLVPHPLQADLRDAALRASCGL